MKSNESIVQKGDPVLRKTAQEVDPKLIGGTTLSSEITQMKQALAREHDGVALAAPQIGISRRMFVVADKVFEENDSSSDRVYINPQISNTSKKQALLEEGCLSVRYLYGKVQRFTNVTISYLNEDGEKQTRGAGGLLAHIFQHEIDHLNGILFVDKAQELEELSAQEKKEFDAKRKNHDQD